ncbi:hypothetical protein [Bifidobacterium sp.]|uniref:hypothetical protein n=1 Tax=Bifidobacterium sp. TaxID=41200 RepID=UPI0025C1DA7C|nr:hypothetical protein [Bifidobacterium sp.]MCI1634601.1 hypothetical protein [Bifidobacterium sp.]
MMMVKESRDAPTAVASETPRIIGVIALLVGATFVTVLNETVMGGGHTAFDARDEHHGGDGTMADHGVHADHVRGDSHDWIGT